MTEHLRHEKRGPAGRDSGNIPNGTRGKTVLTEATGQVQVEVPRDRAGMSEPQIVKERQRRLTGVDEIVLSLYAKGLTTGEISAHSGEIYGASVPKRPSPGSPHKIVEEMQSWQSRPLDGVYAAVFLDAIVVKVRDGQVANRPIYAAIGVGLDGEKDILGLWAGSGGEGAKFWMSVLTEIRNRGVKNVFFLVCDELKGLPEVVTNVWPLTTVQTSSVPIMVAGWSRRSPAPPRGGPMRTRHLRGPHAVCIIHLIRNTFRVASKKDWDALKRDVKPIYTAVNAAAARRRSTSSPRSGAAAIRRWFG